MGGELTLAHYYTGENRLLRSITSLEREESFRLAREIHDRNGGASTRRFGDDYNGYYEHRLRAEKWLREEILRLPLEPQSRFPLYFLLGRSDMLKRWFGAEEAIVIPLSAISPKVVSFTYGDSMSRLGKPEMRAPFTVWELHKKLETAGGLDAFLEEIREVYTYIEAQVWLGEIPEKIINGGIK
ncbi:MAG: hypothetical protein PHI27_01670 [Eubacteriales bacterium]|nr:hypothetical protein [Eubacteriales bacterium]MDD4511989.1 hypothetical protein [Eubacteriales bacterium]